MKIELPPKYYLTHFKELCSVLSEHYQEFFQPCHVEFLTDFDALSEDAQCLYLRMMNRKGKFFFAEALKYEEIPSPEEALNELKEMNFAGDIEGADQEEVLKILPRKKILELFLEKQIPHKKSWSKDVLIEKLFQTEILPSETLRTLIAQKKNEEVDYLLFLFFGKIQSNLNLYTLRDLGIRKVSGRKVHRARFQTLAESSAHYFYEKLLKLTSGVPEIENWPEPLNDESVELREKVLLRLADDCKQHDNLEGAVAILRHSKGHPGREKRIRLLYQLGDKEKCRAELEEVLTSPYSDSEYLFADDFISRKFNRQKVSLLTETLRNAQIIPIDESYFRHPEEGVQDYFKSLGCQSFHLENYLWNSLFGIFFWEELFESEKTSLYNEFERSPKDLSGKKFFDLHEASILKKFQELLDHKEDCLKRLGETIHLKNGVANGVFGWHESIEHNIEILFQYSETSSIKEVLHYMALDYAARSTGFPDLMVVQDKKIKFCEIKAPGDSIKRHQLLQMIALQRAGIEVQVLQVEYVYNPQQVYVVVDLETTGGGAHFHRITEIGAVKVQNGVVLDKFQTLINPIRRISREIEELTGISNEMVKDAPKFFEVSEAFLEFTKGAIFVAHNVSFDYGFLQAEFNRLEQKFVMPYICTKSWMRKFYPGLPSYGLRSLTDFFAIPLLTHHRALCDAEAAAGLLRLINQKRAETTQIDS